MSNAWNSTSFSDLADAVKVLTELRGKRWLCRGVSKGYAGLLPSIDWQLNPNLMRHEKLALERQSIDTYRSTVRFFADQGEEAALRDDVIALMVLRHFGVPTRLLDWSQSPHVAGYFAACGNETEDGEIWSFDQDSYVARGSKQWEISPETTKDGSGKPEMFAIQMTAFNYEEPPDWFVCTFYPAGFHRQRAQEGLFSLSARFGKDHAQLISQLLGDNSKHHRYVVPARLKPELLKLLREKHGIWRGSLFPDSAGAAATAQTAFTEALLEEKQ